MKNKATIKVFDSNSKIDKQTNKNWIEFSIVSHSTVKASLPSKQSNYKVILPINIATFKEEELIDLVQIKTKSKTQHQQRRKNIQKQKISKVQVLWTSGFTLEAKKGGMVALNLFLTGFSLVLEHHSPAVLSIWFCQGDAAGF